MKIIAETATGVLIEANKDEVALILGFRNRYTDGFKDNMLKIGTDIPITKINQVSSFIRTLDKDKLQSLREQLVLAIDGIDKAADTASEITLFATLSEDEK